MAKGRIDILSRQPQVCVAIARRTLVSFIYDGHSRLVEPHSHGLSLTDHEVLRGYQVGGSSSQGTLGWRIFRVDRMSEVSVSDVSFRPRDDTDRATYDMNTVHCQLEA